MAHPAQEEFIRSCLHRFRNLVAESSSILEVGSQNLNGSVRDYFPFSEDKNWLGLDLGPGSGVDLVVPGELIQLPTG